MRLFRTYQIIEEISIKDVIDIWGMKFKENTIDGEYKER